MTPEDFSALLETFDAYPVGKPQPQGSDFDAACERLESGFGGELTDEVRDFLRICGGHGWGEPVVFPIGNGTKTGVQATLGFVGGAYDIETTVGLMGTRLPKGCVPLAIDPLGNFVCLDTESGEILFWDHEMAPEDATVSELEPVADDLGAWLEIWEAEDEDDE